MIFRPSAATRDSCRDYCFLTFRTSGQAPEKMTLLVKMIIPNHKKPWNTPKAKRTFAKSLPLPRTLRPERPALVRVQRPIMAAYRE